MASRSSIEEIIAMFPSYAPAEIASAIAYYYDHRRWLSLVDTLGSGQLQDIVLGVVEADDRRAPLEEAQNLRVAPDEAVEISCRSGDPSLPLRALVGGTAP
jgi:hypothetical protein